MYYLTFCAPVHRTHVFADPSAFEEPLLDTSISVVLDEKDSLISVSQVGLGTSDNDDILSQCIARARKRRIEIHSIKALQ